MKEALRAKYPWLLYVFTTWAATDLHGAGGGSYMGWLAFSELMDATAVR